MKKIVAIIAAALAFSAAASAQLGVIGGLTMSSADARTDNFDPSTVSLYHFGVTYNVDFGILSVQPSVIYQVKGASLDKVLAGEEGSLSTKVVSNTGYVEVPVALKAGLDLVMFKPYVFVEPFLGFAVTTDENLKGDISLLGSGTASDKQSVVNKWSETAKNRLEYGFGVGAGLELSGHLQISAQYFLNLGNLYDEDGTVDIDAVARTVQASYKEKANYKGFKISLAYLF